ncbi:MAG TPA: L,D-transpeptidase family protein [Chloroflexota bacterium]|nr:L,D-transpeptidase family protein [Chloroflexota bacterium]
MRFRFARPAIVALTILVTLIGASVGPTRAVAARPSGILLFVAAGNRFVTAGTTQKVWVHTMALAGVELKVDYGNGQVVTQRARTDSGGTYLFRWPVNYTGSSVTLARFWVHVTRGSLGTAARGDFVLFPAPPLGIHAAVLTPSIYAGDEVKVAAKSRPNTDLTVSVRGEDGHVVVTQKVRTDATGAVTASVPVSVTIAQPHQMQVVVSGQRLGRFSSAVEGFKLVPAPATQVSLLAGIPISGALGASPDEARRLARDAAGGSWTTAQRNARLAVQAITVDLQVLGQWTSAIPGHGAGYYTNVLDHATSYDQLIDVTAQALTDDGPVEARMRSVMPHQAIMVSIGEQVLRAYQDGQLVMSTYVTTGRPELPTVTGHFYIYEKVTPFQFISPWPPGSPYYYPPTWIKYWMPFYQGYGLHDAWWRAHYGPGTNVTGDGPGSSEPTGTHGCVNIPFANAQWLWNWAPVGTPVVVYGGPYVAPGSAAGI